MVLKLKPKDKQILDSFKRRASVFYDKNLTWEEYVKLIADACDAKLQDLEEMRK